MCTEKADKDILRMSGGLRLHIHGIIFRRFFLSKEIYRLIKPGYNGEEAEKYKVGVNLCNNIKKMTKKE